MNISTVDKDYCTACGACKSLCPKDCISMSRDEYDNVFPLIDTAECIECGKCARICPAVNPVDLHKVEKAYAGWHVDSEIRRLSASGGVASAFYDYFQTKEGICFGVEARGGECYFVKCDLSKIASNRFRNSKYVYTEVGVVIKEIIEELKNNKKVLCIGVPCQIAAIRNAVDEKIYPNLLLIDVICHGFTSSEYLKQHIINSSKGRKISAISFRNPVFGTDKYHLTLEDKDGIYFDKTVNDADEYQIGYHKGITYRDNCYHCNYAKIERVGDITIADYWGLGKVYSWDYSTENVSLIYGSTKKGLMAISDVVNAGFLEIYERPLQESVSTQGQLNKPTSITVRRKRFKAYYKKTHDFDLSIRKAMKMDIKFIGTPYYSKLILIRRLVRKIFKVDI